MLMRIFLITNLSGTSRSSSTASSASPTPSTLPSTAACPGKLSALHTSHSNRQSHNFFRQFRTTFRALFLNPIQGWFSGCRQREASGQEQETTTVIGAKSRLDTCGGTTSTKVSKVVSAAASHTCSDTNGLLTTNLWLSRREWKSDLKKILFS